MKTILKIIMGSVLVLALTLNVFAQTDLRFTAVAQTDEQAIRLTWTSTNNEVYEIDEADQLAGNEDGSTLWTKLYDEYPSQGTNTFWLDTGNYFNTPPILHPKNMPMRFYRIVDKGADTSSDEPSVSITSPTNNTVVSGELTITVIAITDQPVLSGTKLYVDGQEMQIADSKTNYIDGSTNYEADTYTINTCEWPNGSHVLFATAKCASDFGGPIRGSAILTGHAVSAFVPVDFDNLVTRISFSEPFFDPALGQTQKVSAVFAANADWTLQIIDINSNIVRNATGGGTSMLFNWNGTDNDGTNVPAGVYYYYISAQTNGASSMSMMSAGENSFSSSAANFSAASGDVTELWALSPESSAPLPLAIYPPGIDTNGFTIFEASQLEVQALTKAVTPADKPLRAAKSSKMTAIDSEGGENFPFEANSSSSGLPAPASQNSPPSPQRPSTAPKAGTVGYFGLAYQEYDGGISLATPLSGLSQLHVQIQGSTGTVGCPFLESVSEQYFITQMGRGAWQPGFVKANGDLHASDLRKASLGGSNVFNTNNVSLGLLSLHGAYGTSQDADQASGANFAQQIYFPIDGRPTSSPSWVRMSEMDFGSAGTNGLKWMTLLACNSLRQQNWNSIRNAGWKPFNSNLHLLLGANSNCDSGNLIIWAKFMLGLDFNQARPIMDAWRDSEPYSAHGPIAFAVAGYDDCKQDMLTGTNSYTPQGSVFYQAFTPQ